METKKNDNTQQNILKIHERDNTAVALKDLKKEETVAIDGNMIRLADDIPAGHKFALCDIPEGEILYKYGYPIGRATSFLQAGTWVHTHNTATTLDVMPVYQYNKKTKQILEQEPLSFMGYKRSDGKTGIRNEIWIINTVGCVNKTAETISRLANEKYRNRTDGIKSFAHPYGCSQMGEDRENTMKVLAAMVNHPNAAGVLVLGLGCEDCNIDIFSEKLDDVDERRVKFLNTQDAEDEIEIALALIGELVDYAESFRREPCPISDLVCGLKCGGSDAFSGVTANPLVGVFSDRLIAMGGTAILTEVPEMFGAETILMDRCETEELYGQTVDMIQNFKEYYIKNHQVVYDNPSPGNKKGGITTLEEKSLGCIHKGGSANVTQVLKYGQQVEQKGLVLLEGPGNDLVSVTALVAAGAQIVLFTTGRGTPYGGAVPTVKISTNSRLARMKSNWIDFNAGKLLDGVPMDPCAEELTNLILEIASGDKKAKNEQNGYSEIAIFKNGVTC